MRLILLFLSSIASFGSAMCISMLVDFSSSNQSTSEYFLLLSFISPLASIKTNTVFILSLKKYSGSLNLLKIIELTIMSLIWVYFFNFYKNSFLASIACLTCYFCSRSLSNITTKLSIASALKNNFTGPIRSIEANLIRLLSFGLTLISAIYFKNFIGSETNPPILALCASAVALNIYDLARLKNVHQENLNSINYPAPSSNKVKEQIVIITQLLTSINIACWTSMDRWLLGSLKISAEHFRSTAWAQTIAIAIASICFSSLYKFCKPKKTVSLRGMDIGVDKFFFVFMSVCLVTSLSLSEIFTNTYPTLRAYTNIESFNILNVGLLSIFLQRLGLYFVYQEENPKWNLIQVFSMLLSILISGLGFYFIAQNNIYYGELFIAACSLIWFLFISISKFYYRNLMNE